MKHLSHKTWGADRTTLLRLYTSLLKPKIEYGCEAYASAKLYLLKGTYLILDDGCQLHAVGHADAPPVSPPPATDLLPTGHRDLWEEKKNHG